MGWGDLRPEGICNERVPSGWCWRFVLLHLAREDPTQASWQAMIEPTPPFFEGSTG